MFRTLTTTGPQNEEYSAALQKQRSLCVALAQIQRSGGTHNHLGNVITTISDRKIQENGIDGTVVGAVDYYTPDIVTTTDYYAFGMAMPGRTQPPSGVAGYRYAHNGQEKDNEIFDGALSAEFWEYDSRLGRRWEMDPITNASESSYATFANNPIAASDPDGLAPKWLKDIGRFFKNPFKYKKHRYTNFKNGGNKHTNHIGKAFMKVVGIGRKIFTGAKTARRLIPQGHDNYRIVDISGQNVQPGSEGPSDNVKQAIDQDLASNGIQSPFAKKVVGIYGGVWNGDAAIDPATGQLVNGGDIGGFVSVEGIVSGSGWHSLFMNTGFRGFMQTRAKTPNL